MTDHRLSVIMRSRHSVTQTPQRALDQDSPLECSIESNPLPAILCSLRDLRYVMVNRGFLALTDSQDEDWLGRSLYERNILEGVANQQAVKCALTDAQMIPPSEADLPMPGGDRRRVIVAGQPVSVAGQSCMLFTVTDIAAWHAAERRHEQVQVSFETVFTSSSSCMMMVCAIDNVVEVANASLCSLLGYTADEIAGRSIDDMDIWPSGIKSGFVLAKCGSLVECLVSRVAITIADQPYDLWTFQDVTRRRIDERNLAAAIEAAIAESKWLGHAILDNLARKARPSQDTATSGLSDLSARERDVLALICKGMDDKTMARTLNVSGNTVRNHVARVYSKIGVNRRVAAAAWGRARGFDSGADRTTLLECAD